MTTQHTAQHTPGPWYHSCDEGNRYCNINSGDMVLDLEPPIGMDKDEHEANARLMAAAPDLLAALEALIATEPDTTPWAYAMNQARAAISKARGA